MPTIPISFPYGIANRYRLTAYANNNNFATLDIVYNGSNTLTAAITYANFSDDIVTFATPYLNVYYHN